MRTRDLVIPAIVSALAGVIVWSVVSSLTGQAEAWDAPIYWRVGYPALAVVCGVLGWFYPVHAWAWGVIAMTIQALPSFAQSPVGELWVVSVVILGVISLPLALVGRLAALARQRVTKRPSE